MQVPIEQLLNLPDIQVLNLEIGVCEIKCEIESTRGYSIRRRRGQKAIYPLGRIGLRRLRRARPLS